MPEQKEKTIKPTVEDIYELYIKDGTLRKITERLFEIAREYKMRNRWISYNSFTFTYRGTNIFNITMRATMSNKGVRTIDPTNHLIILLSLGKKHEVETLLLEQPKDMRSEYINNRAISCGVCAGTPEGQIIRNLTCDKVLDFNESGEIYHLCTVNFGYSRHNPSAEQFEMIERFIMARITSIDYEKSKNKNLHSK